MILEVSRQIKMETRLIGTEQIVLQTRLGVEFNFCEKNSQLHNETRPLGNYIGASSNLGAYPWPGNIWSCLIENLKSIKYFWRSEYKWNVNSLRVRKNILPLSTGNTSRNRRMCQATWQNLFKMLSNHERLEPRFSPERRDIFQFRGSIEFLS